VSELSIARDRERVERQRRGGRGGFSIQPAVPEDFDGSWQFCRVYFRQNRNGDGGGWSVDYPRADINVSIRLSELTKTTVSFAGPEEPNHVVIRLTDPTLFQCPFIMMTEVGAAYISEDEAEALRNYLLKGGSLWADDFWGECREAWTEQITKAFPCAFPRRTAERSSAVRTIFAIGGGVPNRRSVLVGTGGGTSDVPERPMPRAASSISRAHHGVDDAQHRHRRFVGRGSVEPAVLYEFSTKIARSASMRSSRNDSLTGSRESGTGSSPLALSEFCSARIHQQSSTCDGPCAATVSASSSATPARHVCPAGGGADQPIGSFTTGVSTRMSSTWASPLSTSLV
jgi:hypothetical protein